MPLDKNKKKSILSKIISGVKDFINPAGAQGKAGADFANQVMRYDELIPAKKVTAKPITTQAKKIYSPEMIRKEADQIFAKNNQTGPLAKYKNKATWQFPNVDEFSTNDYKNEVNRVKDQVTKTRKAMSR